MSKTSKWEYLKAIYQRYHKASRVSRQQILDEFCQVCGYHRKYAIRLLNGPLPEKHKGRPKKTKNYLWFSGNLHPGRYLGGIWIPLVCKTQGTPSLVDALGKKAFSSNIRSRTPTFVDQSSHNRPKAQEQKEDTKEEYL